MTQDEPLCRITATDAAAAALDELRAEHGELVLHITGGAEEAGTPICLPAGELRIGAQDIHLGRVHGVDVYEMRSRPEGHFRTGSFVVDLTQGLPVGFSLLPSGGTRFVIREPQRDSDQAFHSSA